MTSTGKSYLKLKSKNNDLREQLQLVTDRADILQDLLDIVKEEDSLRKLEITKNKNIELMKLLNSIVRTLNYRFGIDSWLEEEFEASNFDTCDSIGASDGIASILRNYNKKQTNMVNIT
jgi:hypothetical protein